MVGITDNFWYLALLSNGDTIQTGDASDTTIFDTVFVDTYHVHASSETRCNTLGGCYSDLEYLGLPVGFNNFTDNWIGSGSFTPNYGNYGSHFKWRDNDKGYYTYTRPYGTTGGDLFTVFGSNPHHRLHLWDTLVPNFNHIEHSIFYKDHLFFISGYADSSTHHDHRYLISHYQDTGLYGYQNQELKWHLDEYGNYVKGQYANFTESNGKVYFNGSAWNNRGDTAGTGNHMYVLYQCQNSSSTFAKTSCDIYTSPSGKQWNTSGVYQDTIENYSGCDSIMTISLTISTPAVQIDQINACDSLVWINGVTYTSSNNTAIDTLTNQFGCDSIVALDLTISNSNNTTDIVTACNTYTWINGVTYTKSNNSASDTLLNSEGCDSIVYLDLTINKSDSVIESLTACDTYTWIDGNTYTASNNTASHTLMNMNGCDSIVYLDLSISYSEVYTDSIESCDSYTWIDGNTYTSFNNTASVVLQNSQGCDSTIYLHLTINSSSSTVDVVQACANYTWIDGNTYTSSNNTASYLLTSSNGCDSTINLDLTITKIDRQLTAASSSLTANESGASYQWLDCNNGFAIVPGETGQTFVASGNGSYAVEITKNSCIDTSYCYVVVFFIGMEEVTENEFISFHPNPTSGKVEMTSSFALNNAILNVSNNKGKLIKSFTNIEGRKFSFNIDDYPDGIYYLSLIYEDQTIHSKILKNR